MIYIISIFYFVSRPTLFKFSELFVWHLPVFQYSTKFVLHKIEITYLIVNINHDRIHDRDVRRTPSRPPPTVTLIKTRQDAWDKSPQTNLHLQVTIKYVSWDSNKYNKAKILCKTFYLSFDNICTKFWWVTESASCSLLTTSWSGNKF